MPKVRVNLADIPDAPGQIEVGRWRAELIDVDEDVSQAGNDMLVWTWEVKEGPSKGTEGKTYTVLDDEKLFGLKQHLTAFGIDKESKYNGDVEEFIGEEAVLIVGESKYRDRQTGEERTGSQIRRVVALGSGDDEDDDDEPRAKKSKVKKSSRNGSKSNGSKRRRHDDDDDDDTDDDLPFE